MKYPHLLAACIAIVGLGLALVGGIAYANSVESTLLHAVAGTNFAQKRNGVAMQRLAFQQDDLLPIYGSSELNIPDPYKASKIFMLYPTGFNIFNVSGDGAEPLEYTQMLADIGEGVRGKRVVISISPQFLYEATATPEAFYGNFSRLHAYGFALANLPWDIKQHVAQRILSYPDAVKDDEILSLVLHSMAGDSAWNHAEFTALMPIAWLQKGILEMQDHWGLMTYFRNHPNINPEIIKHTQKVNWAQLKVKAQPYAEAHATNNPFGVENREWKTIWGPYAATRKNDTTDEGFLRSLNRSHGWEDLALLLGTLRTLGAKPLLISLPLHQSFWAYRGVSPVALAKFYDKVHAFAAEQKVDWVTFEEFQNDKYFLRDPGAHMSAKGWVYYSQLLDTFFHNGVGATAQ